MKNRHIRWYLCMSIVFLFGIASGAVIQKTIGLGNILRAAGIPYPTAMPSSVPTSLPIDDIPSAYRGNMHLFILAGQSNMVGYAPLPENNKSDPRIYVFGNDYHWRIASEPVDSGSNQVDQVSLDRVEGFGPSMAFAFESLDHDAQALIGLIPCAKSSSSIGQWQRDLSDQSLYGSCLKRARAASPMGQISGVLFFQGETDALDPLQYPEYAPNAYHWGELFTRFVTDFRQDIADPELPVVFAQIGTNTAPEEFTSWNVVKDQQQSIQLPMVAMITTDDLRLLDGLHFTAESYQVIGRRFAEAYWVLLQQEPDK